MRELIQFNWQGFNALAGIKVGVGLIVMLLLQSLTGESWLTTGLIAMFVWLTNIPGPIKDRIGGMISFAAVAAIMTVIFEQIGLEIWSNLIAISIIAIVGTLVLTLGMRAFMVGFSLICWAIYGPFMVATTSLENCLLAILVGTGAVVILNVISEIFSKNDQAAESTDTGAAESPSPGPDKGYVVAYAISVALVLAITTYYGWAELQTDPTMMAGSAFFIIGFDSRKTWIAGFARLLGLIGGALTGLFLASALGSGIVLDILMVIACGLSFAAISVHPGAWMYFFMVFVAIGWLGLDPGAFDLTVAEKLYGETAGVMVAMLAIMFLQWWQNRRNELNEKE